MLKAIALGLAAGLTPLCALADEVGQVTATLGGEERTWYAISVKRGEETASTASLKNSKRLSSLTIQAHPEPRFTTSDVLSLDADWFGLAAAGKAPTTVEILYLPQGMSNPFYTTDQVETRPVMTFDTLAIDGETGQTAGSFTARLCRVAKLYEAPDTSDCLDLEGRFDTQLRIR